MPLTSRIESRLVASSRSLSFSPDRDRLRLERRSYLLLMSPAAPVVVAFVALPPLVSQSLEASMCGMCGSGRVMVSRERTPGSGSGCLEVDCDGLP